MTPAFNALRTVDSHVQTIHATPERIHELLCPVREAEWLEGWSARTIHSASGFAEENGVFATDDGSPRGPTIWLVTRRDSLRHETQFVYVAPGMQAVRIDIRVEGVDARHSKVHITYTRTGTSEAGNEAIAEARRKGAFPVLMARWEAAMNHYLATGECLRAA